MANLGIPQNTIAVLQKYGFNFQKKFGQNFLIDTNVLDRIISAAEITKDDCVLEIGPGAGVMTRHLAQAGANVTAVELDESLRPVLDAVLGGTEGARVVFGDAMKIDIFELMQGKPYRVIANLPYYITADVVI